MIGGKEPNDAVTQRPSHTRRRPWQNEFSTPEMDHHLAGEEPGNRRNGYRKKTVITDTGQIELEVPRDRQPRFDPQLIATRGRQFTVGLPRQQIR